MLKKPANTLNSPDMLFNSSDIDLNQREYSSMYVDIYTTVWLKIAYCFVMKAKFKRTTRFGNDRKIGTIQEQPPP